MQVHSCRPRFFLGCLLAMLCTSWLVQAQESNSEHLGPRRYENCLLRAEHAVDVPALETGVLQELSVELNDPVQHNAVVARLDCDKAELALQVAQWQLRLAQHMEAVNSQIDFHRFSVEHRREEYDNRQRIASRVSGAELRQKEWELEQAKAALVQSRAAKEDSIIEAQLKSASVEAAHLTLERRAVKAPIAGVVSEIYKQAGQWVEAGESVLKLTNLEHLLVDQSIPWEGKPAEILQAKVKIEAYVGSELVELDGEVHSFDHEVSAQGRVRVHVRVKNLQENGTWLLLPGSKVALLFESGPQGERQNGAGQTFISHRPQN